MQSDFFVNQNFLISSFSYIFCRWTRKAKTSKCQDSDELETGTTPMTMNNFSSHLAAAQPGQTKRLIHPIVIACANWLAQADIQLLRQHWLLQWVVKNSRKLGGVKAPETKTSFKQRNAREEKIQRGNLGVRKSAGLIETKKSGKQDCHATKILRSVTLYIEGLSKAGVCITTDLARG